MGILFQVDAGGILQTCMQKCR